MKHLKQKLLHFQFGWKMCLLCTIAYVGVYVCVMNLCLPVKLDTHVSFTATSSLLRHCLILTQNASLVPTQLTPSLSCTPFLAEPFTESQFSLVSADGQAKLRNTWLLHSSAELSNNGSVNIFVNHLKMWKHVVEVLRSPTLILEDDVLLTAALVPKLEELLHYLQRDNATNYVVKLENHRPLWVWLQWLHQYSIHPYSVKKCTCRPHHISSSSAAYVIDTHAADTLIRNAYPLNLHVDVYQHFMGCVYRIINLYAFSPAVVRAHARPSIHWRDTSTWHRSYLLFIEMTEGWQLGTCPFGIQSLMPRWL